MRYLVHEFINSVAYCFKPNYKFSKRSGEACLALFGRPPVAPTSPHSVAGKNTSPYFRVTVLVAFAAVFFCSAAVCAQETTRPGPNILILTVDSFRPDRLGCYGYARALTPNIDRLAREGVLFSKAYSTAAWTNASLVSMLTGLYPGVHGVERRGQSVPEALVTALEVLSKAGYYVPEINYLFPMPNYRNLGFTPDSCRDVPKFLAACRDTTFFAWYHFHGPHLPYNPPEKFLKKFLSGKKPSGKAVQAVQANILMPRGEFRFSPEEQKFVGALYDGEVAAQDEELGQVLEALDSLGLREHTIVILSADHGEELFDHGWLGHASTSFSGTLFEELIHIPLIVSWPGRLPEGKRVEELVQAVDLIPNLFELLGLELKVPCQGKSFLGLMRGEKVKEGARQTIFCETSVCGYQCPDSLEPDWLRCVRTERFKLVESIAPGENPRYALYDLQTDPGELHDAARRFPLETERLKGLLLAQVFENRSLRSAITAAQALDSARAGLNGLFQGLSRLEVIFPEEGEVVTYLSREGKVPVSWTGPAAGEYLVEYEVGQGKYHLKGSFQVKGNSQTFGPFNPVFWRALPLYNPWSFRVMPRGKPELASAWRNFKFE